MVKITILCTSIFIFFIANWKTRLWIETQQLLHKCKQLVTNYIYETHSQKSASSALFHVFQFLRIRHIAYICLCRPTHKKQQNVPLVNPSSMLRHFFSCENEIESLPLDFYTNKTRNFLAIEFIFFTRKWKKNHIQNTEKRKAVSPHQVYFKLLRGDDDSADTHRNSLRRCFSDPPPIDTQGRPSNCFVIVDISRRHLQCKKGAS